MKYIFSLMILSTLFLFSCNKTFTGVEATIQWQGDYAVDGCGFFIILNDKEYKPTDESIIPETYKDQYESHVLIDYKLSDDKVEYFCGMSKMEMSGIEIQKIQDQ